MVCVSGWVFDECPYHHYPAIAFGIGDRRCRNVVAALPLIIVFALLYGIGPGIAFALQAMLYNTVARFFGGITVWVDRQDSPNEVQNAPRKVQISAEHAQILERAKRLNQR
jgi:hypothetical protein